MGVRCPSCHRNWPNKGGAKTIACICGQEILTDASEASTTTLRLPAPPPSGPGTELTAIFKELGIKPNKSCGCAAKASQMDAAGVKQCRLDREAWLMELKAGFDAASWLEKVTAGATAFVSGVPMNLGGLFDLACERAEAKGHVRPPLKVAFLTPGLTCGGAERWLISLCRNFDPAKIWVQAIGVELSRNIVPMMAAELPKHILVISEWENILPVAKVVDFLIVWGSTNMVEAARVSGKPFVVVAHGATESEQSFTALITRAGIAAGGATACVNEACLACYPEENRGMVKVIPNGADEDRVKPTASREDARRELGVCPEQKLLLYLGRVAKDKDIASLVAAVDCLPPEWVCVIAGPCSNPAQFSGRIKHVQPRNHVGDLLGAADVQILLSKNEAHPVSLTEGWLAGVPTVTSDLPWIESIHRQHGPMSWIVPLDASPERTAGVILEADAAGRGSEQVLHAQEVARLEFTAAKMARRWEEFISSLPSRSV